MIARKYLVPRAARGARARRRTASRSTTTRSRWSSASTRARPASATSSGRSPRSSARRRGRSPRETRRRSTSTPRSCASGSARAASRARCASAPPTPASRPASPSPPSAATCSSSRRPRIPAAGASRSRASSARSCRSRPRRRTRGCAPMPMQLGVDPEWFEKNDIHVHVPAGAVPKDGPSAGVTMATAIVSLVTGRPVSERVGMTGEITLTGQVLQIGGLREKVLAAQRAGLEKVILPRENEADLADLPEETREQIEFVLADTIDDVLGRPSTRRGAVGRPAVAGGASGGGGVCVEGPAGTRIRRNRPKGRACVQRRRRTRTRGLMSGARSATKRCATTSRTRSTRPRTSTTSSSADAAGSPSHSVSRPTRDIHENLKKISDDLRKSVDRVQGKADHTGRNLFLLLTGVVIGVLFNPISGPATRKWLKDKVFGAEPEFSYQGNGPAASSASSSSASSASLQHASASRVGRAARPGSRLRRGPCPLRAPA